MEGWTVPKLGYADAPTALAIAMCRIITHAELQHSNDNELRALFNRLTQELTRSDPGTPGRRVALTNLDTVQRFMAVRMTALSLKSPVC